VTDLARATNPAASCLLAGLLLASLPGACGPVSPQARVMRHVLSLPRNTTGVFLNEDLVFYFTSDLDRASVTSESVRITAKDGRAARGTLTVEGRALKFTPAPVLAADLSDGGYAPGTAYQVEIRGFPAVDGLRGTQGEPLEHTSHFGFTTVTAEPGNLMFVDQAPEKTRLLALFPPPASAADSRYVVGVGDPIYLASGKPIDPVTLQEGAFRLVRVKDRVTVELRARLVENEGEAHRAPAPAGTSDTSAWEREPRAALIALTPLSKPSTGEWILLRSEAAASPRDFSAHPLAGPGRFAREIEVTGNTNTFGELALEFLDRTLLSPVALPGVDGSAFCGAGRVTVRYPAAAGDGARGDVVLGETLADLDVQALSIQLGQGETCTLAGEPGLVVLRCQGRMRIGGQLRRTTGRKEAADAGLALAARPGARTAPEPLSAWLVRMRKEDRNCTVLIAGGDIVIEAEAEVALDTPLLLVAGGIVRIEGSVHVTSGSVFILKDGGGLHVDPPSQTADLLTMDEPPRESNPLVRELHYAVLSSPLPSRGSVLAWKRAERDGSPAPNDRWSVRFVREIGAMPKSIAELEPVDDPMALDPSGSIQVLIELWVGPGPTFDPPFVDSVRLSFDQRVPGRSH
jgi:hypothetical protein